MNNSVHLRLKIFLVLITLCKRERRQCIYLRPRPTTLNEKASPWNEEDTIRVSKTAVTN